MSAPDSRLRAYLTAPWPITCDCLEPGHWVLTIETLPGLEVVGPTPEATRAALPDALRAYCEQAWRTGEPLPPPPR